MTISKHLIYSKREAGKDKRARNKTELTLF